ncbi:ATP-grasp domain-containing protein [Rivularia sp. UHCC 0363]|uniref:ATP-grasp domain-containing protein n=1 Tax=Rivularia sp. UHCC 0363 TaxID=3110244 RepID=UPI002B21D248|nr:ATP-grasp domain-containing protein [Rivularia sp. UHCC 0363]MEA5597645.1 ATP-grasp domain-containing protein [Rivularia sp. UHCC 0363]
MKKASVLIPDQCNNPLAYYVIRCLKEASSEFEINVVVSSDKVSHDNSWLVFYKHSSFVDNIIFAENPIDSVEYLDEIIRIVENNKIDIIYPASEEGYKFVSKYRDKLSKFCKLSALASREAFNIAFDKSKFGEFLQGEKVPTPKTVLVSEFQQGVKLNYPILFKPIRGSGGKDIQKFNSPDEVIIPANYDLYQENYVVQEYITGYDIDCNLLCFAGKILAHTVQQPLGVESGFSPKIDKLKFVHDATVLEVVEQAMTSLKWSGITHLDLRYCSKTGKLYIIEMNPRFWQSLMGSLSVGVNFPYLLYLLSNDISFEPVSYPEKYYAKFPRFIKDALSGSLQYSLSDTNFKYFLSDLNGLLKMIYHKRMNKNSFFIAKVPSIP